MKHVYDAYPPVSVHQHTIEQINRRGYEIEYGLQLVGGEPRGGVCG
jgi:hypothetical protein